jgi:DNA-binding Lrp family transcriptional regulator
VSFLGEWLLIIGVTMNELKLYNTATTISELRDLAISEANQVEECGKNTVMHAWKAGNYLLSIKNQLPHGSFGDWLKENWEREMRTAYNYMALGQMLNLQCVANLTSVNEALRICQQEAKPKIRERVLEYIQENPGCTDEQIAESLDEKPASVRGRRKELCDDGLVEKVGVVAAGRKPVSTYAVIPENRQPEQEVKDAEPVLVSLGEALRGATRRKSVDADYLSEKTGIAKSKIQAWLELSDQASGYKAVIQDGKAFAIHRQRIKSDKQFIKEVKSQSLHGDATPEAALASDLDSIGNKIEGVVRLYSPGCKDFSAWNRLSEDDRKNLKFLLNSAKAKVEKHFPFFLGLISK